MRNLQMFLSRSENSSINVRGDVAMHVGIKDIQYSIT